MNTYLKSLVVLIVAVFAFASVPAQAVTVTFGGQVPLDGSGLTSAIGVNANNVALPGYFIETFDLPGGLPGTFPIPGGTYTVETPGGGFMSLNPLTDLKIISGNNIGIRTGTVGYAATPANDVTAFAYGPGPNGGTLPTEIRVDYAADLQTYLKGYKISYLGLYYGSIDTYNDILFYSGNNLITGAGIMSDGMITGQEVLDSQVPVGNSGDRFQPGSNVYVNLFFDPSENFTAFDFQTTGIAFETDNIVVGVSPVPEPATMLLLGLGLVGLAGMRRKFQN